MLTPLEAGLQADPCPFIEGGGGGGGGGAWGLKIERQKQKFKFNAGLAFSVFG